jgi:hypothetical protein
MAALVFFFLFGCENEYGSSVESASLQNGALSSVAAFARNSMWA